MAGKSTAWEEGSIRLSAGTRAVPGQEVEAKEAGGKESHMPQEGLPLSTLNPHNGRMSQMRSLFPSDRYVN